MTAELHHPIEPTVAYETPHGFMVQSSIESFLASDLGRVLRGHVQLVFTSPPFPLRRKKRYGNRQGQDYMDWLASLARPLGEMLTPNGSIVVEMGNAWNTGEPTMSVLGLKALLHFVERGDLKLCQLFVCDNPSRLPGPIEWVNRRRIRVKDSFTHVWWMSPSASPLANNREVLKPYSKSMSKLLERKTYNSGTRPSEHRIGAKSFLLENGGAIPSNVLSFSNTTSTDDYLEYCKKNGIERHPARMPRGLAEFFIRFLTKENDIVFDPFAGSNTTGAAADVLGRRWVSCEPNHKYVVGSRGRFDRLRDVFP
jgi:DNA modification methylase